ncbi:uncharacterized protein METZ01_LOCUS6909 [marine metagenome]|uniref:Uncharacterized protein n=1 Tax=marine metagenome TaxID=408172 RepID=A0A381NHL2_9ZZZZ|tara:strand:- start:64 stop:735 length:672 start_codon:yes stop_codon:yes gene_type:complete
MPPKQSYWFHLGYALERLRSIAPDAAEEVHISKGRPGTTGQNTSEDARITWPPLKDLATPEAVAILSKLLRTWQPRHKTALSSLVRAGAAGAVSALILDLIRTTISDSEIPTLDRETGDRLLAGIRQGLLYGAILEPKVPGPTVLKGALYGTIEYAVNPMGGLSQLLATHDSQHPHSVLENLLEEFDSHDRSYTEHVIFGVILALLYGSSASSNGILVEDEER